MRGSFRLRTCGAFQPDLVTKALMSAAALAPWPAICPPSLVARAGARRRQPVRRISCGSSSTVSLFVPRSHLTARQPCTPTTSPILLMSPGFAPTRDRGALHRSLSCRRSHHAPSVKHADDPALLIDAGCSARGGTGRARRSDRSSPRRQTKARLPSPSLPYPDHTPAFGDGGGFADVRTTGQVS